jgi:hypothetical protein
VEDFEARIVEALAELRSQFCIIDGEAVACDESGMAIRYCRYHETIFLYALTGSS